MLFIVLSELREGTCRMDARLSEPSATIPVLPRSQSDHRFAGGKQRDPGEALILLARNDCGHKELCLSCACEAHR